jgi:hypothetical protein
MRHLIIAISAFCMLLLARPVHAHGLEETASNEASFQQLVRDANEMLFPVAKQQHVQVKLALHGSNAVATETADRTRNRIVNLMANALVTAPSGSTVVASFDPQSYTLTIEVRNKSTLTSTRRDIVDSTGGVFHLTTLAGQGSRLEASLLDAPLTQADLQ